STNTKDDMVHDIDTTLSFISQHMTLEPGDVIFSGTPQSTTALKPGDVVEVHVDGCGVLSNPVAAEA
ncbi:MAG: fumarylacetoacetate hydrolase family protein, partial [Chloroflexi bacterium]|nr:fumarylacetoacetate hydrolase family protein [Chloroflexota bacterium]